MQYACLGSVEGLDQLSTSLYLSVKYGAEKSSLIGKGSENLQQILAHPQLTEASV